MIHKGHTTAKAGSLYGSVDHESEHEDRKGSDTLVVRPALNDSAPWAEGQRLPYQAPSVQPLSLWCESSEAMPRGGSIVASLKLKGIDGLAPQAVDFAVQLDSTPENLPGQHALVRDGLAVLLQVCEGWCMATRSSWDDLSA